MHRIKYKKGIKSMTEYERNKPNENIAFDKQEILLIAEAYRRGRIFFILGIIAVFIGFFA